MRRLFRVVVLLFVLLFFCCRRRRLCVNSSLSRIAREQTLYLSGEQSVPHENAQASNGAAWGREEEESFLSSPLSGLLARIVL